MSTSDTATERYLVVVNDEEQYSIWPEGRELPAGWRAEGTSGSKEICLDHIEKVWTDMRPRSLRERLAAGIAGAGGPVAPVAPATDDAAEAPLVERLAAGSHPVVVAGVGDRAAAEAIERFRQRLERGYVNVLFTQTSGGTELSLRFDPATVDRSRCDFARRSGSLAIAADLNLDGVDVRCEVELTLADLAGTGRLVRSS
jgi:uncharacterized protein YbdZ (MbtH family)